MNVWIKESGQVLAVTARAFVMLSALLLWGCDTTGYAKNDRGEPPAVGNEGSEDEFDSIESLLDDENEPAKLFKPEILVAFDDKKCPVGTRFRARVGSATGPRIILKTGLPISKAVLPRIRWVGLQKIDPPPTQKPYWERFKEPYAVYFSPLRSQLLVSDEKGVVGPELLLEADQLPVDIEFKYSIVRVRYDQGVPKVFPTDDPDYCPPLDPRIRITR